MLKNAKHQFAYSSNGYDKMKTNYLKSIFIYHYLNISNVYLFTKMRFKYIFIPFNFFIKSQHISQRVFELRFN